MLILLVKLLDCNHTGADHISGLHRDSRCSFFLRCHFAFCIDGRYLFIGAAVGNLGFCSGRRQLWLDCEGFALFSVLLSGTLFIPVGATFSTVTFTVTFFFPAFTVILAVPDFFAVMTPFLADRYDLLIRRADSLPCLLS